ncbi:MAG: hypothetical protein ACK4OE_06975 [Acidovorax sp.]|uniref:hypothetical protein n=1 Tax=Acidovorax sp. TaxID=1872122 RepID=UPI00391BA74E
MKLVPHGSFDDRQQALTAALIEAIARELKKVDAPEELVEQLTGSIAFAVTALIDDSTPEDFAGGTLSPMLTFQIGEDALAYAGGNTWMHEYVFRLLPAVLQKLNGASGA